MRRMKSKQKIVNEDSDDENDEKLQQQTKVQQRQIKNKNTKIKNYIIFVFIFLSIIMLTGLTAIFIYQYKRQSSKELKQRFKKRQIQIPVKIKDYSQEVIANNNNIQQIKSNIKQQIISQIKNTQDIKNDQSVQQSNIKIKPIEKTQRYKISEQKKNGNILKYQQQDISRQQALKKYYSEGLKQYYERITHKIKVITYHKTIFKTNQNEQIAQNKQKQNKITYVVNGLTNLNRQFSYKSLTNLINLSSQGQSIVWLVQSQNKIIENVPIFSYNLQSFLNQNQLQYKIAIQNIQSNYQFIKKYINSQWVIYLHNQIQLNGFDYSFIQQNNKLAYLISKQNKLLNEQIDLSSISNKDISNTLVIFKSKIIDFILPFNFAYQNVYTLDQLLIYPVLASAQMANSFTIQSYFSFQKYQTQTLYNQTLFVLNKLSKLQQMSLCFLAGPTVANQNNIQEIKRYINQFDQIFVQNQDKLGSVRTVLIISIVYNGFQSNLYQIMNRILGGLSYVKIKFRHQKIQLPLQIYEISYGYCPKESLIFSSRFNVIPNISNLISTYNQNQLCKYNNLVILSSYKNQIGQIIKIIPLDDFKDKKRSEYINKINDYFFNAQIFCQQLTSIMRLQIFKWQQLQFYQTQTSYTLPMIQIFYINLKYEQKDIYKIVQKRKISQKQQIQLKGLILRQKYKKVNNNKLQTLQHCQLNNHAYKRNPQQQIPRVLHQIWLSDANQISPIRKATMDTLIQTNPQFQYILWTKQNVTKRNFPITYDGILKFQKLSKENRRNYRALIADLMRIQILYKYGGIYLDLKIQGKKSLLPFLKYEEFFLVANQQSLVNGLIGTAKGNKHFKKILEQFFDPKILKKPEKHIYELTGGTKIIEAYTLEQVYKQVLNFQQFILEGPRPCVNDYSQKQPQQNQKLFTGVTAFVKKYNYRIMIPCKEDMEKYLQLYDIIGRTYFPGANKFN